MFLYFLRQRQLSPEPGSGGGTLSLDDLDNDDDITPVKDEDEDEDPDEDDEPKKPAAKAKEEPEPEPEPEKVLEIPKEKPEESADDEDDEEGETEDSFWDEVDALRGEPLDVDYGDVDPVTPEGALIRERAVADQAIATFEADLEKTSPRAYAYLLHTMEGGTDEDFFNIVGTDVLPTAEQLENNIEIQKDILTRDLIAKGNSEKVAAAIIKAAIIDDDLEEMAKEALTAAEAARADKIEQVKVRAEEQQKTKESAVTRMTTYVNEVVSTGKIDNITIPEADRKAFAKQFGEKVRYDNGKFLLVTELTNENLAATFKKEFFDFKKGDLNALVEKAARTVNAKRLLSTIGKDKRTKASQTLDNVGNTLGDVE